MNVKKVDVSNAADRQIVITRVISAPRERVWEAMTDLQQVAQWKHMMHGPDGTDYSNLSTFSEIV